jgi:ubiquinone/menaquinone biosynthesis C-methylase UbiE
MAKNDRITWLKEKRGLTEERMDTLWAPIYDQYWGTTIDPTHEKFFQHFLRVCPPGAIVLDAACGTGKYWSLILESGRTIFGIDQSQGMLSRAQAKYPDVPVEKLGLQEIRYQAAFDCAICMDAMEFIPPEDYLQVLTNLSCALKPGAYLYFTVEVADEYEIEQAYKDGQAMGLPVVYGEWAHEEGYHYYPRLEQVEEWIRQAGFRLVDEALRDEYQHYLVQKPG